MSRESYVFREGKLWRREEAPPLARGPRSTLPAPALRRDAMEPIRSMADGKVYDGKSAYYASVKAAGCEIVGDEKKPFERPYELTPDPVEPDIKRAMEEIGSR